MCVMVIDNAVDRLETVVGNAMQLLLKATSMLHLWLSSKQLFETNAV